VRDLLDELVRLYPAVTPSLYTVIITVNREFVDRSHQLNAEDEIALFSPVSGG
jgi:molybdopterin converting factor small subunit